MVTIIALIINHDVWIKYTLSFFNFNYSVSKAVPLKVSKTPRQERAKIGKGFFMMKFDAFLLATFAGG